MYLKGFPVDYDYLGRFPLDYQFLEGLGSTNTDWVNRFQNPFNSNSLGPAAELAKTDKAAAFAKLQPAFDKIKADAIAFVNSYGVGPARQAAQATVDRWRASDWPLIQGFLNDWASAGAASLVVPQAQVVYGSDQQQPNIFAAPAIGIPTSAPGGGVQYLPASGGTVVVPGAAPAATGSDMSSIISEWGPWIAGAAILGFMLSSRGRPRQS